MFLGFRVGPVGLALGLGFSISAFVRLQCQVLLQGLRFGMYRVYGVLAVDMVLSGRVFVLVTVGPSGTCRLQCQDSSGRPHCQKFEDVLNITQTHAQTGS